MKVLHVDSSILGGHSVSRQLSAGIVARLREATPDLEVTYPGPRGRACAASVWLRSWRAATGN
jgi:hypothetical protein